MNPWDKRFSSDEYFFGTKPAEALIKQVHHLIPDGDTLVVADGEGRAHDTNRYTRLGLQSPTKPRE